jgi:hypothetical protein
LTITVSREIQAPEVIVQIYLYVPEVKLKAVVAGVVPAAGENTENGESGVFDQAPVPTVGVLPKIFVAVPLQIVWSAPALAVVGAGSGTFIVTSSVETAHEPLEIVHLKT